MSCPWNNSPRMDKGSFDWMQIIKSKQDIREDSNRLFRPASSIWNHSMSLLTSWAKYICGAKYYIWNGPEILGAFSGKALYVYLGLFPLPDLSQSGNVSELYSKQRRRLPRLELIVYQLGIFFFYRLHITRCGLLKQKTLQPWHQEKVIIKIMKSLLAYFLGHTC